MRFQSNMRCSSRLFGPGSITIRLRALLHHLAYSMRPKLPEAIQCKKINGHGHEPHPTHGRKARKATHGATETWRLRRRGRKGRRRCQCCRCGGASQVKFSPTVCKEEVLDELRALICSTSPKKPATAPVNHLAPKPTWVLDFAGCPVIRRRRRPCGVSGFFLLCLCSRCSHRISSLE